MFYSAFIIMILATSTLSVIADSLRIGAFNVQIFGRKKASKENVVATLSKVSYGLAL